MNKKDKLIEIVKNEIGGESQHTSRSFVIPGVVRVSKNDKITWTATNIGARIIFPKEELIGKKELTLKSGQSKTETVSENAKRSAYPYIVITDDGNIAVGGSYPVVIID